MRLSVIFIIALLLLPNAGLASSQILIEVVQPMDIEEGVVLASTPFVYWSSGRPAGIEASYTCRENTIHVGSQGSTGNFNIANKYGIECKVDLDWNYGPADTLDVTLDLSNVQVPERWHPLKVVVEATVEAVLTNASRDNRLTHVRIEILGRSGLEGLGGTYSLEELGPFPRKRMFR